MTIVEPRGGPAEGLVARRTVADHAVGSVDCLVECGARKPGYDHPDDRRDDRIGKVFSEALDCRAGDAGGVKLCRVAANDARHSDAAGGSAVLLKRDCDIRHVPVKTALCDEAAGDETRGNNPERQPQ